MTYLSPSVSLRAGHDPGEVSSRPGRWPSRASAPPRPPRCVLAWAPAPLPIILLASGVLGPHGIPEAPQGFIEGPRVGSARAGPHVHVSLGGAEAYQVGLRRRPSRSIIRDAWSILKYLAFTGNHNRDLSHDDIERRLPTNLKSFSALLYTLTDFRIALHIKPQPVGDTVRIALAKGRLSMAWTPRLEEPSPATTRRAGA